MSEGSERIWILIEGSGPEWARTMIVDANDDTIFASSVAITTDLENIVQGNAIHANEPVIIDNAHVYVPIRWLAKQYPESANICGTLERQVREHIATDKRESMRPGIYKVRVQIAPILCFECHKHVKVVRGYLYGNAFVALHKVSDTQQMTALIADLRKRDPTITPVGFNYSGTVRDQYFAARCPECSTICGNFFMTVEFFTGKAPCEFPGCGCDYPNFQCRLFQYHLLSLRLGPYELQDITHQRRRPVPLTRQR